MPIPRKGGAAPSQGGGIPRKTTTTAAPPPVDEDYVPSAPVDEGPGIGTAAVAGAATLGAGALLAKLKGMPGAVGAVGKGAAYLNAIRQQLMLSGMALPKSLLGNVGTGVEAAVEGRGTGALKEILSMQTVRDAARAVRSGTGQRANPAGSTQVELPGILAIPGRLMGGVDEATQAALRRSGASADEAANATLQTPLSQNYGKFADALDSPAAQYLHPFRRTPFNQFIEGLKKMKAAGDGDTAARRGMAIYGAAGAAHGAATADDSVPMSLPFGVAASGRYGLPYGVAALIGRALAGGKGGGGIAGSMLPVSEYGYEQGLTDPMKPFRKPAALTAIERVTGMKF